MEQSRGDIRSFQRPSKKTTSIEDTFRNFKSFKKPSRSIVTIENACGRIPSKTNRVNGRPINKPIAIALAGNLLTIAGRSQTNSPISKTNGVQTNAISNKVAGKDINETAVKTAEKTESESLTNLIERVSNYFN